MAVQLSDIITPDGQDPARWRAKRQGTGAEMVCGATFVDGVTPAPITDRQARRLIAALGDAVTVEPWGRPARRIDVLSAPVQARVMATIAAERADVVEAYGSRWRELLEPIPTDLELPSALETQRFEAHVVAALDDIDAQLADAMAEPAPFIEAEAAPGAAMPPDVPADSLPLASPDSVPDVVEDRPDAPRLTPAPKPEPEATRQTTSHRKPKK